MTNESLPQGGGARQELIDYCIRYAESIFVLLPIQGRWVNGPLSEVPFSIAIEQIEKWDSEGRFPHRVITESV